jgi:hypothetical protein
MFLFLQEGEPNNIRLLDFQLIRYGSLANDVAYFIFTSTNEELRDEHYENLLQIYHKSLCDFITRLGSDGENLFKYNDFKKQMKKFGRYGLLMSVMVVPIIVAQAVDLPDMDKVAKDMAENKGAAIEMMNMDTVSSGTEQAYKKRITGVVRDIIRLGYY